MRPTVHARPTASSCAVFPHLQWRQAVLAPISTVASRGRGLVLTSAGNAKRLSETVVRLEDSSLLTELFIVGLSPQASQPWVAQLKELLDELQPNQLLLDPVELGSVAVQQVQAAAELAGCQVVPLGHLLNADATSAYQPALLEQAPQAFPGALAGSDPAGVAAGADVGGHGGSSGAGGRGDSSADSDDGSSSSSPPSDRRGGAADGGVRDAAKDPGGVRSSGGLRAGLIDFLKGAVARGAKLTLLLGGTGGGAQHRAGRGDSDSGDGGGAASGWAGAAAGGSCGAAAAGVQRGDLPDLTLRPWGPDTAKAAARQRWVWRRSLPLAHFLLQLKRGGAEWTFITSDSDSDSGSDSDDAADDDSGDGKGVDAADADEDADEDGGTVEASGAPGASGTGRRGARGAGADKDADKDGEGDEYELQIEVGTPLGTTILRILIDASGPSSASSSSSSSASSNSSSKGGGGRSSGGGSGSPRRGGPAQPDRPPSPLERSLEEENEYLAAIQRLEEQWGAQPGGLEADWREAQQRSSTTGRAKADAAGRGGSAEAGAAGGDGDGDAQPLQRPPWRGVGGSEEDSRAGGISSQMEGGGADSQPVNITGSSDANSTSSGDASNRPDSSTSSGSPPLGIGAASGAGAAGAGPPLQQPGDAEDQVLARMASERARAVASAARRRQENGAPRSGQQGGQGSVGAASGSAAAAAAPGEGAGSSALPGGTAAAAGGADGGAAAGGGVEDDADEALFARAAAEFLMEERLEALQGAQSLRLSGMGLDEVLLLMNGLGKISQGQEPSQAELEVIVRVVKDASVLPDSGAEAGNTGSAGGSGSRAAMLREWRQRRRQRLQQQQQAQSQDPEEEGAAARPAGRRAAANTAWARRQLQLQALAEAGGTDGDGSNDDDDDAGEGSDEGDDTAAARSMLAQLLQLSVRDRPQKEDLSGMRWPSLRPRTGRERRARRVARARWAWRARARQLAGLPAVGRGGASAGAGGAAPSVLPQAQLRGGAQQVTVSAFGRKLLDGLKRQLRSSSSSSSDPAEAAGSSSSSSSAAGEDADSVTLDGGVGGSGTGTFEAERLVQALQLACQAGSGRVVALLPMEQVQLVEAAWVRRSQPPPLNSSDEQL